ncbi:putative ATP-grasp-modified RiPP [Salinactinospora qingdaonensis]|uniref:ATP-grasp target RiPP n=1 Tax=Salinactinospora qingdaonensis TaxID=702744 RepID=A0ABP7F8G9_9ACTN
MQFHDVFPLADADNSGTAVAEPPATVRPFGVRHAVDVPADPEQTAETERAYYDPQRQISMVEVEGVSVPMMKRQSGETTTSTNSDDRQAPDDDTDVGPAS